MPFEPLVCGIDPILTVALVEAVKVATNFVTSVPKGTVAVMFVPETEATTTGVNPSKLNVLITFSEDLGAGAIVTIKDNSINYTETLTEVSPGKYISQHLHGVEGRGYTLTVVVDGKTFTSTSIIPSKVFLDNVSFIDDSFNEGAKIAIPVRNDPAGIQNNYLFDLYLKRSTDSKGWIRDSALMVVDDVFSDGVTTQQPLFGILKLMPNDSIRVTMKCIDRNVYKYFYSLSLNGPNGAATPANPVSNISGGCLGYFSAQTKQTLTKIIPQ